MAPLATVGILSIGEMGMGIAKLLLSQGYRVVTNIEGRSSHTRARVATTSINPLQSDTNLVCEADYILSIVPPRDALATAKRITTALASPPSHYSPRETPLYYLDLNAISPRSARDMAALFEAEAKDLVRFIDGGIIGAAPKLKPSPSSPSEKAERDAADLNNWKRPSIPLSGPHRLAESPHSGEHLLATLNSRHITPTIGSASGLKMTFASTNKGFAAICIQAFTTAQNLGVLGELKDEMRVFNTGMLELGEVLVKGMPPKAYRWVGEMGEITDCFREDGGFEGESIFEGAREVYRAVVEDTVLGQEKTESRKRGRTIEDVATGMNEGLSEKRKKRE